MFCHFSCRVGGDNGAFSFLETALVAGCLCSYSWLLCANRRVEILILVGGGFGREPCWPPHIWIATCLMWPSRKRSLYLAWDIESTVLKMLADPSAITKAPVPLLSKAAFTTWIFFFLGGGGCLVGWDGWVGVIGGWVGVLGGGLGLGGWAGVGGSNIGVWCKRFLNFGVWGLFGLCVHVCVWCVCVSQVYLCVIDGWCLCLSVCFWGFSGLCV